MFGKAWWLLVVCGALDALHSVLNLLMAEPVVGLRRFAGHDAVWQMGVLGLAAGMCAIAAGFWTKGRNGSWLLSLHGLALGVFGFIGVSPLVRGPLSFRWISLLFVLMAVSLGAFALWSARGRTVALAGGAVLLGFALSFGAVGLGGVRLEPEWFWAWMSSYFALCAAMLVWMSGRFTPTGATLR